MNDRIRKVVQEHGRLSTDLSRVPDGASLYDAGMTSHASVNVMLALEDEFDVEFPDEMLTRSAFESDASIRAALEQLGERGDS
jgi:acyl carrier protein